jgi:hypothetical protein
MAVRPGRLAQVLVPQRIPGSVKAFMQGRLRCIKGLGSCLAAALAAASG